MVNTKVLSLTLTPAQTKTLYAAWKEFAVKKVPPYADFQCKVENCVITHYTSGKTVFQGKDAEVYAAPFLKKETTLPQAGSDEVGTGDYFGPVCVCACIVEEKDLEYLRRIGVKDSKAITDPEIRVLAPKLIKRLRYSLLIVENKKYNQVHRTTNMNAIKAKLHNQAYVNLSKRVKLPKFKVIDQFAPKNQYYRYLSNEPTIIQDIHFETKAENKYPAVGAASIIARYAFLQSMDQMEKKYECSFHKGAGSQTNKDAQLFVKKYGKERLNEVAKVHFKNTETIE